MTNQEAIDLMCFMLCKERNEILKDAIKMAIEALKAKTHGDTISRQSALDSIGYDPDGTYGRIKALPSAETPYQYSEAYVNQLRGERDFLQDMVDTMAERLAEPKTKCIAQIKVDRDDIEDMVNEKVNEIADKMSEPKTGKWIEVEVFPEVYDIEGVKSWGSEMQCDQCGFRFTAIEGHIRQYNFCPNCGSYNGGEEE